MEIYKDLTLDEERALYGSDNVQVIDCRFDGPADGESALKESSNVDVKNCYFNLRYPFWHNTNLIIESSDMSELARAAVWYSKNVKIANTRMHGIKALRESSDIVIENCDIESPEFGWFNENVSMKNSKAESEYFMMHTKHMSFDNVLLKGKYSFQYIEDAVFTNCNFKTKDAFWHAKNVVVKDSVVKGEYLAWYSENVTFENCKISGTQPLCYCKNLKLINCQMQDADLAFEKTDVDATILNGIISIKNPKSGVIRVKDVQDIISDDPESKCEIIVG